jgi:hypothetical protein
MPGAISQHIHSGNLAACIDAVEYSCRSSNARKSFSGGIDRRPITEYILENTGDNRLSMVSVI